MRFLVGLQEFKVTKNIAKDAVLWRYMSLDKLINILDTQQLFFTPAYSYLGSDPFEGLPPKIISIIFKDIFLKEGLRNKEKLDYINDNLKHALKPEGLILLEDSLNKMDELPKLMEKIYFRTLKSTVINCWHLNECESEAMWRLYSDNNKGVVIQTTLQDLADSIDDERIFLSEVRYINFNDESLTPNNLMVNGHFSPLLKRESFKHEQEVRLFFQPKADNETLSDPNYQYKPELVSVDLSKLISKIYISPYAQEPYNSSVRAVCRLFGIPEFKIFDSNLLKIEDHLTTWNV